MATGKALDGKPYAGNPHVRFDEGEVAPAATPRRGSLLYKMKKLMMFGAAALLAWAGAAAGERLRALLMTALTTLLGTLPMMVATGAGAASRNHLGTTEFWGMLFSVVFGILLVPGLYALFQTWRENAKRFFAYIGAKAARRRELKDMKGKGK